MIKDAQGVEWGTAAQIAERLGQDVSRAMIRFWVRERGLVKIVVSRHMVVYSLAEVSAVEHEVRASGRGRKRAA